MKKDVKRNLIVGKIMHNELPHAIVMDGDTEVLIPETEINSNLDRDPIGVLLGVEIDFEITGEENGQVFGSRKKAMESIALEHQELKEGDKVEFSVITVKERFLIGTAAGREILVPAQNISNQWVNLKTVIPVNGKFEGTVKDLDLSNQKNPFTLDLSDIYVGEKIDVSHYHVDEQYLGVIDTIMSSSVVVKLLNKDSLNVMCRTVSWTKQPMEGDKAIITISEVKDDSVYGYIKRML